MSQVWWSDSIFFQKVVPQKLQEKLLRKCKFQCWFQELQRLNWLRTAFLLCLLYYYFNFFLRKDSLVFVDQNYFISLVFNSLSFSFPIASKTSWANIKSEVFFNSKEATLHSCTQGSSSGDTFTWVQSPWRFHSERLWNLFDEARNSWSSSNKLDVRNFDSIFLNFLFELIEK